MNTSNVMGKLTRLLPPKKVSVSDDRRTPCQLDPIFLEVTILSLTMTDNVTAGTHYLEMPYVLYL